MTPEEAFEAWWQSLKLWNSAFSKTFRMIGDRRIQKDEAKPVWLACSQHYEEQIEETAKHFERFGNAYWDVAAESLRTRLLTKGGE